MEKSARAGYAEPDKLERRWVAGFALGVMLVTLLPYLIGYAVQGTAWHFTGFMIGVEDGNSYIAKMLNGSEGAWLFRTPYTAYPQYGVLSYIPYLLLGKLAAPPGLHEQLVALYQLFRIVSGFLVIMATYDFIAYFVRKTSLRRFGLILAVLGGGLGWLVLLAGRDSWLGSIPLEFYSPDTFGFLELFGLPHLAIGRALMLWGLLAYLRAGELDISSTIKPGVKIGLFWLGTGLVQPLAGMVVGVVAGIYLLGIISWQVWQKAFKHVSIQWTEIRKRLFLSFWAGMIALPWIAYNFLSLNQDRYLKRWMSQNILPSPHPIHYLLAYGLIIIPAIIGGKYLLKNRPWNGWLPVAWAFALPFLAYAPTSIQRRLPDGIWVALIVLAMAGMEKIDLKKGDRSLLTWFKLSMAFSFPSTIILISGAFLAVWQPRLPVFRPAGEVEAFNHLADTARSGQIVLAAYGTGNALPAWAPVRVLLGHGPESANLDDLSILVAQFYQVGSLDTERRDLLDEFKVNYVFWGPAERSLGDWDPTRVSYLDPVYKSDEYTIFSVR